MLDSAREALNFARGKTRNGLKTDRMLALALVKELEIIGEAAASVSVDCRNAYPNIRWREIVGMRNVLIHAYADIDLDILWDTITEDLPALIAELEKAIGPLETRD